MGILDKSAIGDDKKSQLLEMVANKSQNANNKSANKSGLLDDANKSGNNGNIEMKVRASGPMPQSQ